MGTASKCVDETCKKLNAPMDCIGCHYVVEDQLRGVLTFDMHLLKWRE